ncbi:MAG: hypothetical protein AAGC55_25915 [Myxococcota bacterium]
MIRFSTSLLEDMLIRVPTLGGLGCVCPLKRLMARAGKLGLRRVAVVATTEPDSGWGNRWAVSRLTALVAAVEQLRAAHPLAVELGIEAAFADEHGRLDMPAAALGIDSIYTSDHLFPLNGVCYTPAELRVLIARHEVTEPQLVDALLDALCNAMVCHRNLVMAPPFALLARVGIAESLISAEQLGRLVHVALHTGATLVISEDARAPTQRTISRFSSAGVPVLVGSGTHDSSRVGRYRYCRDVVKQISADERQ